MADGDLASVLAFDATRRRRRPAVRATRIPAERSPGVVVLTDAEWDDELHAAALDDLATRLGDILDAPIAADPRERRCQVVQVVARLLAAAQDAAECDESQVDAVDSYEAEVDALIARLGEIRARGAAMIDDELDERIEAARGGISEALSALTKIEARAREMRTEVENTVRAACAWENKIESAEADAVRIRLDETLAERDNLRARVAELTVQRDAAWREGAEAVRDAAMSVLDDILPDGPESSDCAWAHELMHRVAAAVARGRALPLPTRPEVPRG